MGRIDQIKQDKGFPEQVRNVPPNYPDHPQPGKISLLWKFNKENLWHRFSPYTDGDNIFGIFPNKQPFVYRYPDETKDSFFDKLPKPVKALADAGNLTKGTVDDLVRVSKFTYSPAGVLFNVTQFGLQALNPYDETRLYNPLSPILASVSQMSFGLVQRPTRHIELNLGGALSAIGIPIGLPPQAPASTAGISALSKDNSSQGKGLIRGETANAGQANLNLKWGQGSSISGGILGSFASMIKTAAVKAFGLSRPSQPSGTQYRADEKTYVLMVNATDKFKTYTPLGTEINVTPRWVAKDKIYSKTVTQDASAQLDNWKDYSKSKINSTFNDPSLPSTQQLADELQKIVRGLGSNNSYNVLTNTNSRLISSGNVSSLGYDKKFSNITPNQQKNERGVGADYRPSRFSGPRPVDKTLSSRNLRMATTFTSDGLNQLGVLAGDKKIVSSPSLAKSYPGWTEYKPYEDDLIAFFFYDVVNSKYIPFRATIKGLSEGNAAFWDELRFIGRADQLYSYNGFSRTLGFTFNVVISSVTELLPTWQKINYMASAVKPSNYTTGERLGTGPFSRFIVPPMFMITVGDLYKYQPIVITSVNVNVPDDAIWETLNENNSDKWSYLTNLIQCPDIGKNYGQLPREVEIAMTCNLLEKERAIVGGSHFGHAPRKDDWENFQGNERFVVGGKDYLPSVTDFHANSVVFNKADTKPVLIDAGTPFNREVSNVA
jgi:hypothetical protein